MDRRLDIRHLLFDDLKELLMLIGGSFIYAIGVSFFLDPNKISPGGVTGIAFVLSHFLPFETGLINFVINLPLFVAGWIRFHDKFIARTVLSLAISSIVMDIIPDSFEQYVPITSDLVISSLAGGALMSIGLALVYLGGGSTGGTDIIIKFIRQKYIHVKTGMLSFLLDCIIGSISVFVFKEIDLGLYAVLTLVVQGYVLDRMLYGGDEAKLVYIISDKHDEISKYLLNELEIGVTFVKGVGAYTGTEKNVVLCAFRKQLYQRVRQIIKSIDPEAFLIVTNATEVFGEGFKDHFADEI